MENSDHWRCVNHGRARRLPRRSNLVVPARDGWSVYSSIVFLTALTSTMAQIRRSEARFRWMEVPGKWSRDRGGYGSSFAYTSSKTSQEMRMAMPPDALSARFVRSQLETGITSWKVVRNRAATICSTSVPWVAPPGCLGNTKLRTVPLDFCKHSPMTHSGPGRSRTLNSRRPSPKGCALWERRRSWRTPPYRFDKMLDRIRSSASTEKHFALCLKGRQEARTLAASGLHLEEVGDTLAVLGEFEAARSVASDPALEALSPEWRPVRSDDRAVPARVRRGGQHAVGGIRVHRARSYVANSFGLGACRS